MPAVAGRPVRLSSAGCPQHHRHPEDPSRQVEPSLTDIDRRRQQQCRHAHLERAAVRPGPVADHQGLFGLGSQVTERQFEDCRVGLLHAVLERHDIRVDGDR
jgi:hypothetical protein